jgi:hypothetical protein
VAASGVRASSIGWPTLPSHDWDPHARLLTIEEAAKSVQRPASTIRRWLTEGLRVHARLGSRPLILEADLLRHEAKVRRTVRRIWDNKNPREAGTSGGMTD